jgi:hypothetical protein
MGYWNMQEYSDLNTFQVWAGERRREREGEIVRHCSFLTRRHRMKLDIFLIAYLNYSFKGASFEFKKILATLIPEKSQGFY